MVSGSEHSLLSAFDGHSVDQLRFALGAGVNLTQPVRRKLPVYHLLEEYTRNDRVKGMNRKLINKGLIAAAVMNISGVLVFSRAFTNPAINEADPVVMSNFGLLMIVVWGLAYLSATSISPNIRWLAGAFAIEKLVYFVVWIKWLFANSLAELYAKDAFAGVFYSIYGINDFVFMLFFAYIFFLVKAERTDIES